MKAMIANTRRVLVAADCSKFDRTATVRVCGLRDLAALFTDAAPSPGLKDLADCQGVEIVVAEPKSARPSACG
jgi:DeoR family glycerol-3-phosphate regulon repressor